MIPKPMEASEAPRSLFRAENIQQIAAYCAASRSYIAVEGFCGSGKSTLADKLSQISGRVVISLDRLVSNEPHRINETYQESLIEANSEISSTAHPLQLSRASPFKTRPAALSRAKR